MSDIHSRQVEAGVAMTISVARLVKQYIEENDGDEMEKATIRLQKVMEGYIEEDKSFQDGMKVLTDMRGRLCKVSGGDWPDVEEEYKRLVKNNKKNVTVEKHSWWKEFKKTIESEVGESKGMESGDDELEMTQVEVNTVCPISRKEMTKPVKNLICGHVYDKHSMESLLQQNPMCRCPVVGCPSSRAVEKRNLVEDKETKKAIHNNKK